MRRRSRCWAVCESSFSGHVGRETESSWGISCEVVDSSSAVVFPLTRKGLQHDSYHFLQLRQVTQLRSSFDELCLAVLRPKRDTSRHLVAESGRTGRPTGVLPHSGGHCLVWSSIIPSLRVRHPCWSCSRTSSSLDPWVERKLLPCRWSCGRPLQSEVFPDPGRGGGKLKILPLPTTS